MNSYGGKRLDFEILLSELGQAWTRHTIRHFERNDGKTPFERLFQAMAG
jgi:hypothetical protein